MNVGLAARAIAGPVFGVLAGWSVVRRAVFAAGVSRLWSWWFPAVVLAVPGRGPGGSRGCPGGSRPWSWWLPVLAVAVSFLPGNVRRGRKKNRARLTGPGVLAGWMVIGGRFQAQGGLATSG